MDIPETNVILLTVDCLRADHLSSYGYERETTPNIDDLADNNVRYTNAYSVSSHTREAVSGFLTGHYPDRAIDQKYRLSETTVAERLQEQEVATGAFHSNPFVSRAYGYSSGFDEFNDDLYLGQNKFVALAQRLLDKLRNRHYARAEEINERAIKWIDSLDDDRPFFLWNHYMDPHGPYEPVNTHRNRFADQPVSDNRAQALYKRSTSDPSEVSEDDQRALIDLYDAEIRYTDEQIGNMLSELERRGLLSDSLLILTADHGDAFGEHDYYGHPRRLHDELVHVPMIVSTPERGPTTVETPVSTLDVAETIVPGAGHPDGESLRSPSNIEPDRVVFSQARSEDKPGIRYFSARSANQWSLIEYDTEREEVVSTGGDSMHQRSIRKHIESRSTTTDLSEDGSEGNREIDRRLSALGYKE